MGLRKTIQNFLFGKKEDINTVVRKHMELWDPDARALVVSVTEENALQVPAFFGGVSVLAQSMAMLPLITYKRLSNDQRERATITEYNLFKNAINRNVTSYEWRFATIVKLVFKGNSFTRLFWDVDRKQVLAMQFLDHDSHTFDGLVYEIQLGMKKVVLPREDVIHFKWFTQDGIVGKGVLEHALTALGFLIAAERYGKSFFENGALPFVLLIHPGELGAIAKSNIIESWKRKHLNRGHEPAVIEEGMQVKVLNVPNNESQFLELRSFQLQEISRFLRITPHKLQDLERATFSNVVELNQSFVIDSLMPIATNMQQRIQLDVFRDRPEFFCEFLFDDLLRGNTQDRFETYRIAIQNRILTVNEVRRLENRNDLTPEQINEMMEILASVPPNEGGIMNRQDPDKPVGREAKGIKEAEATW